MDNTKNDKYYLNKIIEDIEFVINTTKNMTLEEFDNDEIINSAINFKFSNLWKSLFNLIKN